MAKKGNNNIFDLVFSEEKTIVSKKENIVYDIFSEEIMLNLTVTRNDTTISSVEERYIGRVNLKINNV